MRSEVRPETFHCSASFVRPFVEVLAKGKPVSDEAWKNLGMASDARLPIQEAYQLLSNVVDQTHDPLLGLKAAARMDLGDVGVIDYLMSTAPTIADAAAIAPRYFVLLNEALSCRLDHQGDRAVLRFDSRVPQPAAAEDFMLCSMVRAQGWLRDITDLQCWFRHADPPDPQPYKDQLGTVGLRFGAELTGFVFPRAELERPLPGADPKLHAVVRTLADLLLAQHAARCSTFSERVETVLATELGRPSLSAADVARRLQTSGRTLARRLGAEGTSFYTLLDRARKARALQLMKDSDQALGDIARATGFAHVASFHRAFRRWTGQTPAEYRIRTTMMQ